MTFLTGFLKKRTDLSLGAPELKMNDVLNIILQETESDPSPGAPEIKMNDFLSTILKQADRSEPGSFRGQNL